MATAKNVALQGIGYGATQTALQGFGEAATTFSAALTDGPDSLAASVSVVVTASVSASDGADTLSASVSPIVTASVAATDGADTVSASVSPVVTASSATTDGADSLSASVSPVATFSSAATDGADSLSASVNVLGVAVFSAALSDGPDTLSATVVVQGNDVQPIGGAGHLNVPSRERLAELARKQRRALGILPAPVREKVKALARKVVQSEDEETKTEVREFIASIPMAERIGVARALQNAAEFYAGLMLAITASNRAGVQSHKEIESIRRRVKKTSAMLKQITTETVSMVEEEDIIFLTMQLMACID